MKNAEFVCLACLTVHTTKLYYYYYMYTIVVGVGGGGGGGGGAFCNASCAVALPESFWVNSASHVLLGKPARYRTLMENLGCATQGKPVTTNVGMRQALVCGL